MQLSEVINKLTEYSKQCTIDPQTNVLYVRFDAAVAARQTNVRVVTDDSRDRATTETVGDE